MDSQDGKDKKTFTEEIEVFGSQLVQQVKDLLKEGNVRQLRIKASDGDIMLETPLTFGVVAGGAVALAAPWLAILGAIAAFVTKARLEIVREMDDEAEEAVVAAPAKAPAVKSAAKARSSAKAKPVAASSTASKAKPAAAKAKPAKAKSAPKVRAKASDA